MAIIFFTFRLEFVNIETGRKGLTIQDLFQLGCENIFSYIINREGATITQKFRWGELREILIHNIIIEYYCVKSPNIKAPTCAIFHTVILFSRDISHMRSPVLPRLLASIIGGQLTSESPFQVIESSRS